MILTYGAPDTYCVRCALRVTETVTEYSHRAERRLRDDPIPPHWTRPPHMCPPERVQGLERYRNRWKPPRVPLNSFGSIHYDPAFFLPQMAVCPDCSAPVGQPCINRGTKLPTPTKHAHKARNFAALKVRGLEVKTLYGVRVLDRLNRRYIRASHYHLWSFVDYEKGALICENI